MKSSYAVTADVPEIMQSPSETAGVEEKSRSASIASTAPGGIPTFGGYGEIYAIEARRAGRLNAAAASAEEYEHLLRDRQTLLDKRFEGTLSRREANRLEYIRWSLDRIEDARSGEALDILENLASQYEQFRRDVDRLSGDILKQMPRRRK
jgi:hypothetical protein